MNTDDYMAEREYGLIIPKIETREEGAEHLLGAFLAPVINPSGSWIQWKPEDEPQNINGVEVQACTTFGTLNAIETLLRFKGFLVNYSDRYLAIASLTNPYKGNDPHKVCETLRTKSGCVGESFLPWTPDIRKPEDYYNVDIGPLRNEGNKWYDTWELRHEWVPKGKENLKEALTRGTVAVSVSAWFLREGEYYKPTGTMDNHWVQLLEVRSDGRYTIFDSYDSYIKILSADYDFSLAKVFYLLPAQPRLSLMQQILDAVKKLLGLDTQLLKVIKQEEVKMAVPPVPMADSRIVKLAKAIEKYENVNVSLNNPGGLRYSPFQNGYIIQGSTGKRLATFETYQKGFDALCHQIEIVCNGTSNAYTKEAKTIGIKNCAELTLRLFLGIYAPRYENDTETYVSFIENQTGISRSTTMKELI